MAQPAPANASGPSSPVKVCSGCRPKASTPAGSSAVEPGGAAGVADVGRRGGHHLGGGRDLGVGDAEDDRLARGDLAAADGPVHAEAGSSQRTAQRGAEAASANHAHGGATRRALS